MMDGDRVIYRQANGSDSALIANGCDRLSLLADAEQHIKLLTGSADTPVWLRAFDDARKDFSKASKVFGTVADRWPEIERLQAVGCGIFVVVNEGGNSDAEITCISWDLIGQTVLAV